MLDPMRHELLFQPATWDIPITVIGCGGVGSCLVDGLFRLGVGINSLVTLYDFDTVARHNLANQCFGPNDIGQNKAKVLAKRYRKWDSRYQVRAITKAATSRTRLDGLIFLCPDDMDVRKDIVVSATRKPGVVGVIETRMDALHAISHAFDPHLDAQRRRWMSLWISNEETENLQGCNGHVSIINTVQMTAALAISQFVAFARTRNMAEINENKINVDLQKMKMRCERWLLDGSILVA